MANLGKRVSKVTEVATKAARRISIAGSNGLGFELVAIEVRRQPRILEDISRAKIISPDSLSTSSAILAPLHRLPQKAPATTFESISFECR